MSGAASLLSAFGAAGEGDAASGAAEINAQNIEFNAVQIKKKRIEDEQNFLSNVRRDRAQNILSISASGIRLEGSPLDVLRENTSNVEKDLANIRLGALTEQQAFRRQAFNERRRGREASRAANIRAGANLLQSAEEFGAFGGK